MNKIFCKFKYFLKRSKYIKILKQNDISAAFSYIDDYKKMLEKSLNINHKEIVKHELNILKNFSIYYINKLAEKALKNNDIYSILKGYNYICQNYMNDINKLNSTYLDKINLPDLESILLNESLKIKNNLKKNEIICEIYTEQGRYSKAVEYYDKFLIKAEKDDLSILDYYYMAGTIYFIMNFPLKQDNIYYLNKTLFYYTKIYDHHFFKYHILRVIILIAIVIRDYDLAYKYFNIFIESGYNADKFLARCYSNGCIRNKDYENWKKYYYIGYDFIEGKTFLKLNKPGWTGKENISNSILLIISSLGLGDDFLMWGYITRIKKLAKKVIWLMNDLTYCLFKENDLGIEVYPMSNTKDLEYDYYVLSMHIPISLNLTLQNVSVHGGYIKANKDLVNIYKEKYFNTNKFKIGIAFKGDIKRKRSSSRNIPAEKLQILDSLDNVQFYCFTKDVKEEQLNGFKRNSIINIAKEFSSFLDTAAAIENTDIMVCSDNCVLNLAGAMGKTSVGLFCYGYAVERWFILSEYECKLFDSIKPIINNSDDNWEISLNKAVDKIKCIMLSEKNLIVN